MKSVLKFGAVLLVLSALVFSGCPNPMQGGETGTGTVTINLGGGPRSAVWPPTDEMLSVMELIVTLQGATGTKTHKLEKGVNTAKFSLVAGRWDITVDAFYNSAPYGKGTSSVTVRAGQSTPVTIPMKYAGGADESDFIITFDVANVTDWEAAANGIKNGSDTDYIINIAAEIYGFPGVSANTFGSRIGITVAIQKSSALASPPSINFVGTDSSMFIVGAGQNVVIRDVALKGGGTNNAPLVHVNGGIFTMEGGASVSGNDSLNTDGGGVYVSGAGSEFIMKSGTISNNRSDYGGGVHITNNGKFTMIGGTISGNDAYSGGGVYVDNGGIFEMSGTAEIRDNTFADNGGGVFIGVGCTFEMSGTAKITGNTNTGGGSSNGGGVFIYEGSFTMNGGIISGNDADLYGGGVYISSDGVFTMNSGTISGNTAGSGGGAYVYGGTFNMDGATAEIAGNTASTTGGVYVGSNMVSGMQSKFQMANGVIYGTNAGAPLANTQNVSATAYVTLNANGPYAVIERGTFVNGVWTGGVAFSAANNNTIRVINGVLQ